MGFVYGFLIFEAVLVVVGLGFALYPVASLLFGSDRVDEVLDRVIHPFQKKVSRLGF